ncbi:hypothetical protein EDD85DRAFT_786439 [Armillaria nabsnona]|nr:hypothetical protein EDD85DRAFT_786439 [Armillaria nabsnona]
MHLVIFHVDEPIKSGDHTETLSEDLGMIFLSLKSRLRLSSYRDGSQLWIWLFREPSRPMARKDRLTVKVLGRIHYHITVVDSLSVWASSSLLGEPSTNVGGGRTVDYIRETAVRPQHISKLWLNIAGAEEHTLIVCFIFRLLLPLSSIYVKAFGDSEIEVWLLFDAGIATNVAAKPNWFEGFMEMNPIGEFLWRNEWCQVRNALFGWSSGYSCTTT